MLSYRCSAIDALVVVIFGVLALAGYYYPNGTIGGLGTFIGKNITIGLLAGGGIVFLVSLLACISHKGGRRG